MFDFDVVTGPMPGPGARRGEKPESKQAEPLESAAPGEAAPGDDVSTGAQGRPLGRHLE